VTSAPGAPIFEPETIRMPTGIGEAPPTRMTRWSRTPGCFSCTAVATSPLSSRGATVDQTVAHLAAAPIACASLDSPGRRSRAPRSIRHVAGGCSACTRCTEHNSRPGRALAPASEKRHRYSNVTKPTNTASYG
jgi:hypothetical protein